MMMEIEGRGILEKLTNREGGIYYEVCTCPYCGGEGYVEHLAGGWDYPIYDQVTCPACNGQQELPFPEALGWAMRHDIEAFEVCIQEVTSRSLLYVGDLAAAIADEAPEPWRPTDEQRAVMLKYMPAKSIELIVELVKQNQERG